MLSKGATIENKFTRTRAHNFLCPLFSNGRDGSSQVDIYDLGNEKQMSKNVATKA